MPIGMVHADLLNMAIDQSTVKAWPLHGATLTTHISAENHGEVILNFNIMASVSL